MNRRLHMLQTGLATLLCLAVPAFSWASISNTATASYSDASSNPYTATSGTVSTLHLPAITSAASASGQKGANFTYTITASGGPITSYTAASLPAGLTLNATTGVISGVPTTAGGPTNVTLTATNADGTSAPFTLALTITPAATPTISLTKTVDKTSVVSGATLTYTIQYQNTGTANAANVIIKDVIPTGTTLVTNSITGGGTSSAGTITWTIGTVTAGAAASSVSFQVTVN